MVKSKLIFPGNNIQNVVPFPVSDKVISDGLSG